MPCWTSVRVSSMRRMRNASKTNPAAKNASAFQGPCPALDLFISLMLEFLGDAIARSFLRTSLGSSLKSSLLRSSLTAAVLVLSATLAPTAQTAIPRAADGHPDLQGIWQAKNA